MRYFKELKMEIIDFYKHKFPEKFQGSKTEDFVFASLISNAITGLFVFVSLWVVSFILFPMHLIFVGAMIMPNFIGLRYVGQRRNRPQLIKFATHGVYFCIVSIVLSALFCWGYFGHGLR